MLRLLITLYLVRSGDIIRIGVRVDVAAVKITETLDLLRDSFIREKYIKLTFDIISEPWALLYAYLYIRHISFHCPLSDILKGRIPGHLDRSPSQSLEDWKLKCLWLLYFEVWHNNTWHPADIRIMYVVYLWDIIVHTGSQISQVEVSQVALRGRGSRTLKHSRAWMLAIQTTRISTLRSISDTLGRQTHLSLFDMLGLNWHE